MSDVNYALHNIFNILSILRPVSFVRSVKSFPYNIVSNISRNSIKAYSLFEIFLIFFSLSVLWFYLIFFEKKSSFLLFVFESLLMGGGALNHIEFIFDNFKSLIISICKFKYIWPVSSLNTLKVKGSVREKRKGV